MRRLRTIRRSAAEGQERRRLSERVDRELDADRYYFKVNPERQHRLRPIFPAERAEFERGAPSTPDLAMFVAVQQVLPGRRMRIPIFADVNLNPDSLDEQTCAATFERAIAMSSPWLREAREQMRRGCHDCPC